MKPPTATLPAFFEFPAEISSIEPNPADVAEI